MPDDPLTGKLLNETYAIEQIIADGSTGRVYRAVDRSTGSLVAVKVLYGEIANDDSFRARLLRETELVEKLEHHPNIVSLHGYDETQAG